MLKRPMLLCALVGGVLSVIAFYSEVALFILALVFVGLLFFFIYKRIKPELIFALVIILAITISGFVTAHKAENFEQHDGGGCSGEFVVVEKPQNNGGYYGVTLETINSNLLKKGDRIWVTYSDGNLQYAQVIKAKISLSVNESEAFKRADYANAVFIRGRISKLEITGKTDTSLSVGAAIRNYIKKTVFSNFDPASAATVTALITGEREYLSQEFYNNVKRAGVAHVMVVSGMHLSVIVSLFLYICNKFFYNRFLKATVILFVTVLVMAVCGFTMSILRAGITYVLLALGLALGRESTPENTLGAAVSIILLCNPFAIFSVAFLLSVLSTFAIIVVAVPVSEYLADKRIIKNKLLLGVAASAIISISALIFTAPVTIWIFGYLSCVSVITNLLITLAVSAAMILCILGFVLPFLSAPLFAVGEVVARYVNWVINLLGSQGYAVVFVPKWTAFLALALIIIILWVLLACKNRADMLKLKVMQNKKENEGGKAKYGNNFGAGIKKRNKKC